MIDLSVVHVYETEDGLLRPIVIREPYLEGGTWPKFVLRMAALVERTRGRCDHEQPLVDRASRLIAKSRGEKTILILDFPKASSEVPGMCIFNASDNDQFVPKGRWLCSRDIIFMFVHADSSSMETFVARVAASSLGRHSMSRSWSLVLVVTI